MKKLIIASLLTSVAFAGSAAAQTATTPGAGASDPAAQTETTPPAGGMSSGEAGSATTGGAMESGDMAAGGGAMANEGGFISYQEGSQMLASGLMGADVQGPDGESIGTVDDLLLDTDGQIQAVVVGVGGFLGIGQKDVAIANSELEFVMAQDAAAAEGTAGTAATGDAATPAAPAGTGAAGTAATGTSPTTGATGATGTGTAGTMGGTTGGMAADGAGSGWGWSGAGIDHIQVNYTREQLEEAPEFESAE